MGKGKDFMLSLQPRVDVRSDFKTPFFHKINNGFFLWISGKLSMVYIEERCILNIITLLSSDLLGDTSVFMLVLNACIIGPLATPHSSTSASLVTFRSVV